jgi:hypothetical protein
MTTSVHSSFIKLKFVTDLLSNNKENSLLKYDRYKKTQQKLSFLG